MKKKLIYLTHWRIPSEKTMSPLILKTCEGFVREGWEVELWVPRRHNPGLQHRDPFVYHSIAERFPIRQLPTFDGLRFLGTAGFILLVVLFNIAVVLRLLAQWNKDTVVYAHDLRDVVLPCLLGLQTFVEIHDFYESRLHWLNRIVLRRVSGLIVTNSIKQKRLSDNYGFDMARMLRQPNAVDVGKFSVTTSQREAREKLGFPLAGTIVMYTGHLFGWKGVHTLAEAAGKLSDGTEVYFVGGTETDREALQAFVTEKRIPHITFLPHQEHGNIPLFQKAADVLVLPNTAKDDASKYETSPVKLFEYLASGVPIVASDLPSIREVVSEKEVFFAQPDDPVDFAKVITSVAENPAAATAKTNAALTLATTCSWEARARNIDSFIKRVSDMR